MSELQLRCELEAGPRCEARFGEFVCISVTQLDFDPTIFDRLVQPTLKISVPHTHEVIASKYAEWANVILNENPEDLARGAFVRRQVKHPIG